MRFKVIYKLPKHKKEQKAVFLNIEDSFKWEEHIKANQNAFDETQDVKDLIQYLLVDVEEEKDYPEFDDWAN
jgi:hypothetical protein